MRIQLALLLFTFPLTSIGASYFNQNNTPQRAIGYGEGSFQYLEQYIKSKIILIGVL